MLQYFGALVSVSLYTSAPGMAQAFHNIRWQSWHAADSLLPQPKSGFALGCCFQGAKTNPPRGTGTFNGIHQTSNALVFLGRGKGQLG